MLYLENTDTDGDAAKDSVVAEVVIRRGRSLTAIVRLHNLVTEAFMNVADLSNFP